jgi:hypothetical protein
MSRENLGIALLWKVPIAAGVYRYHPHVREDYGKEMGHRAGFLSGSAGLRYSPVCCSSRQESMSATTDWRVAFKNLVVPISQVAIPVFAVGILVTGARSRDPLATAR